MSDEEIMKKFNEKASENDEKIDNKINQINEVTPYKAVSNLNTSDTTLSGNNQVIFAEKQGTKELLSSDNGQYISSNSEQLSNSNNTSNYMNNVNYNYVPTYDKFKQKKTTIKLTGETLVLIVIVIILFLSILIIPNVYDFIRQIKMR